MILEALSMPVLVGAAAGTCALALVAAAIGIARRDNGIADVFWGPLFIAGALAGATQVADLTVRHVVVIVLLCLWGGRLALHLGRRRVPGGSEDPRYAAWRARWTPRQAIVRSLGKVYLLQAALALLVSTPVLVVLSSGETRLDLLDVIGIAVFTAGLTIEVVADAQVRRFVARRRAGLEHASLYTGGLWSRSRHPNYFGEALLWWGIAIMAASTEGGWIGVVGAATITILVRYVSGVPLLERAWRERPGFDDWASRTPVFVPRLTR